MNHKMHYQSCRSNNPCSGKLRYDIRGRDLVAAAYLGDIRKGIHFIVLTIAPLSNNL